ncbi:GNAT family N-acetyltransferase [Otariodibacter sp.]|uniref:GNAT family N-acetyltransferase n=1 Tax=Otariodibacter sp. TaxID=3030919 RepID=UPI00262FB125|nr:GNAT family N-acetyltransferase [Otariodibacter sp.]
MSVLHDKENHRFIFQTEQNKLIGELNYHYVSDKVLNAYHTEVDVNHQGEGIAGKLYNALIEFAEQNQLKIQPSCSYIEKRMTRSHAELIA